MILEKKKKINNYTWATKTEVDEKESAREAKIIAEKYKEVTPFSGNDQTSNIPEMESKSLQQSA